MEAGVEVQDIKEVLRMAKAELDNGREGRDEEYQAKLEKSVKNVETWLREVGALPPR